MQVRLGNLYSELAKLGVNIDVVMSLKPTQADLEDLYLGLRRLAIEESLRVRCKEVTYPPPVKVCCWCGKENLASFTGCSNCNHKLQGFCHFAAF